MKNINYKWKKELKYKLVKSKEKCRSLKGETGIL